MSYPAQSGIKVGTDRSGPNQPTQTVWTEDWTFLGRTSPLPETQPQNTVGVHTERATLPAQHTSTPWFPVTVTLQKYSFRCRFQMILISRFHHRKGEEMSHKSLPRLADRARDSPGAIHDGHYWNSFHQNYLITAVVKLYIFFKLCSLWKVNKMASFKKGMNTFSVCVADSESGRTLSRSSVGLLT